MVVIRLQRRGTKKRPHHRIVVTVRSHAQSGRVLENIGFYDPSFEPPRFSLDESRLAHWVSLGAQVSTSVERLVKQLKRVAATAKK